MKIENKLIAESVIKHLFIGATIGGIRFGPVLQLLIDFNADRVSPVKGQVYLNLCSKWDIYDAPPQYYPINENQIPNYTADRQLQLLCSIREQTIIDVKLGDVHPHLMLYLKTGQIVFINGLDENYECWNLGVSGGNQNESWSVIVCPNDELAIWAPESFKQIIS